MNILSLDEFPNANPMDINHVIDVIMFIEQSVINRLRPEDDYLLQRAEFMGQFFPWRASCCYQYVACLHKASGSEEKGTFADTLIIVCTQMNGLYRILFSWSSLSAKEKKEACFQYLEMFRLFERILHESVNCSEQTIVQDTKLIKTSSAMEIIMH